MYTFPLRNSGGSHDFQRAKERKHYTDEDIDDDEIEGKRSYSLEEKLQCGDYNGNFVIILKGHEFNLKYLQEHGLKTPIIFYDKTGLGMRVPSANFQVSDVKQCVGSRRTLDVMDVNTQRGLEMSMKEWVKYYETTVREKLLNVISLEFSHTRLENYVESPTVVRQVDWVDTVWPRYLKNCQTESTNIIEKMKYPKVQKYCLMSVAGCYTDFHIDFGGTSVWYHILHGKKVFWLIPPTEVNTEMYENWVLSGKQGDIFLADQVEKCQRIVLEDGYTFIIPSGWIHAVYTPKDSLVFGGNFLHSFNILEQLRVSEVEEKTHVPHKFRYPFYTEILWYVLDRYLSCMTGKTYLLRPETEKEEEFERADSPLGVLQDDSRPPSRDFEEKLSDNERTRGKLDDKDPKGAPPKLSKSITIELTRIDEKSAVRRSSSDEENLTPTKSQRSLRKSGTSAAALESLELRINDLKTRSRSPTSGDKSDPEEDISEKDVKVNNLPKDSISEVSKKYLTKYEFNGLKKLLDCLESLPPSKKCVPKDMMDPDAVLKEIKQMLIDHENDDPTLSITGEQVLYWPNTVKKLKPKIKVGFLTGAKLKSTNKNASSSIRRRRTRCKKCEPCTRQDCGECHYCKDMKKYGGPGRMKQSCISRQCMAPVLPLSAVCMICGKEDVDATEKPDDTISNLMECCICWEIIHPNCLKQKYDDLDNDGVINEDLPKSWECPKCCQGGKQGRPKLRVMKPKMKTTDNRHSSTSSEEHVEVKQEPVFEGKRVTAKEGSSVKEAGPLKMKKRLVQDEKPVKPVVQSDVRERRRRLGRPPAAALTPKTERKLRLKKRKLSNGSQSSDESLPSASVVTRSGRMVKRSCQMSQEVLELDLMLKRPKRERMVMGPEEEDRQNSLQLQSNHHAGARRGQDSRQLESIRGGRLLKKRGKDECGRPLSIQGRKGATDEQERLVVPRQQEELLCQSLPREITISLPLYVVRPAPIAPPPEFVELNSGGKHILNYKLWTQVFGYLDCTDLARCLSVCKTWNRWGINPCLWRKIDLHQTTIKKFHLIGIVQRQPKSLDISSAVISYKQLSWLVARLPQMKELKVINLSCATLSALCSSSCPLLQKLDISWSTGLDEEYFHNLVSPQNDRKPAVKDTSRMNKLKILSAAGTEITDEVLSLFPQHVPNIEKLDLSYCMLITDKAIAHLTSETFSRNNLKEINLTGCCQLTPECLQYLRECPNLMKVDFQSCEKITLTSLQKFVLSSIYKKFLLRNNKQILAYRDTSY